MHQLRRHRATLLRREQMQFPIRCCLSVWHLQGVRQRNRAAMLRKRLWSSSFGSLWLMYGSFRIRGLLSGRRLIVQLLHIVL
jgi:hypothetical protein